MLKRYAQALAAVALACLGGSAMAGDQPAGTIIAETNINACLTDCCPQNCGGFFGSAGILFLKSCGNGNPAFSSFDCTYDNANPITHATSVANFDNGVDLGYRFEIGYHNGCGLGVRARYFRWESTSSVSTVDNLDDFRPDAGLTSRKDTLRPLGLQFSSFGTDINPTFLNFGNRIQVQYFDIEGTRSTRCGCLDLTASLGLRFLRTYQSYDASESL
ncbi:MAG TPA: hypothetical protein PKD72_02000, partial [Gemmatales bacterium]|nr:hypothetical protein [Gemmatales bacterium]